LSTKRTKARNKRRGKDASELALAADSGVLRLHVNMLWNMSYPMERLDREKDGGGSVEWCAACT